MSCILYSPFNAVCVQQRACVCMYVGECKGGRGQKSLRPVNKMREPEKMNEPIARKR